MEVDGRRDQQQAGDPLRSGGRVDRGERAAQAVSEQVDLVLAAPPRGDADRAAEVAIDDVVPLEVSVLVARRAPVDDVDVVAVLDEELGEAAAGAEVEDVVAVDQRGDQQDRRREVSRAAVVEQAPLVLGVDDVGRRQPDRRQPARGAPHEISRPLPNFFHA